MTTPSTRAGRTGKLLLTATLLLAVLTPGGPRAAEACHDVALQAGGSVCLDFQDLPLGQTYPPQSSFTTSGVRVATKVFQWANRVWTNRGYARVVQRGLAGGSGQEIEVNNINLVLEFIPALRSLTLRFGEYGGNLNLRINGDFRNFANFADIDGKRIGGVQVFVVGGGGNDRGGLQIVGPFDDFLVGGQELWIDDLCLTQ